MLSFILSFTTIFTATTKVDTSLIDEIKSIDSTLINRIDYTKNFSFLTMVESVSNYENGMTSDKFEYDQVAYVYSKNDPLAFQMLLATDVKDYIINVKILEKENDLYKLDLDIDTNLFKGVNERNYMFNTCRVVDNETEEDGFLGIPFKNETAGIGYKCTTVKEYGEYVLYKQEKANEVIIIDDVKNYNYRKLQEPDRYFHVLMFNVPFEYDIYDITISYTYDHYVLRNYMNNEWKLDYSKNEIVTIDKTMNTSGGFWWWKYEFSSLGLVSENEHIKVEDKDNYKWYVNYADFQHETIFNGSTSVPVGSYEVRDTVILSISYIKDGEIIKIGVVNQPTDSDFIPNYPDANDLFEKIKDWIINIFKNNFNNIKQFIEDNIIYIVLGVLLILFLPSLIASLFIGIVKLVFGLPIKILKTVLSVLFKRKDKDYDDEY